MEITVHDFRKTAENLREHSPEVVLRKAKEAFSYCTYNKGAMAHRQSKGTPTADIKALSNPNAKFVDSIFHKDESITLITSCGYYLRFYK